MLGTICDVKSVGYKLRAIVDAVTVGIESGYSTNFIGWRTELQEYILLHHEIIEKLANQLTECEDAGREHVGLRDVFEEAMELWMDGEEANVMLDYAISEHNQHNKSINRCKLEEEKNKVVT